MTVSPDPELAALQEHDDQYGTCYAADLVTNRQRGIDYAPQFDEEPVSPDTVTRTAEVLQSSWHGPVNPEFFRREAQRLADAGLLRTETDEHNAAEVAELRQWQQEACKWMELAYAGFLNQQQGSNLLARASSQSDDTSSAGETPAAPPQGGRE